MGTGEGAFMENPLKTDQKIDVSPKAIRCELERMKDLKYGEFSRKLLPGTEHILGVRLPQLRKMAGKIAKDNWQGYLKQASDDSFEEIMLQGMVIGLIQLPPDELFPIISEFIPKINNWSVCDSFCSGLKAAKKYPEDFWRFLQPYVRHTEAFFIRFGLVMILSYFIDQNHIEDIFLYVDSISHEGLYVRLAVAWLLSCCYIKFPVQTLSYLQSCTLDSFTYQKTLSKILESNRVLKEDKDYIRRMKLYKC